MKKIELKAFVCDVKPGLEDPLEVMPRFTLKLVRGENDQRSLGEWSSLLLDLAGGHEPVQVMIEKQN